MNTDQILTRLGIDSLSDMQTTVGRAIGEGRDVIVLSPTGTGKTLAYLLPLVGRADPSLDEVQAVVIVPGRELAMQSASVMKSMGSGLRCMACYGGRMAMEEHRELLKVRPQIVFATPGRLNDHLGKGNISADAVRTLVIDEFDKCLEMGFADEMKAVVDKLPNVRQTVLLSATDAEDIPSFVDADSAERFDYLADGDAPADRIETFTVESPTKDKLVTLGALLRECGDSSSIVFVNYRESVERVAAFLKDEGFAVVAYHGGLDQKEREAALYMFSNGSANVLVSTDLASRGLDIPIVANVIHYHLPESEESYVHRAGRTARWNAGGRGFFILGPEEHLPDYAAERTTSFGLPDTPKPVARPKMATVYIGKGKNNKISKGDVVGFLCKKAGLKSSEIGRIDVRDRYSYAAVPSDKVSHVLKMASGEKIKGVKTVVEAVG